MSQNLTDMAQSFAIILLAITLIIHMKNGHR